MGFLAKLLTLTFIERKDEATSTSAVPNRKVRYAGLAVGIVALVKAVASYYGHDLPPEFESWATEAIVAMIFTVLYFVKPKQGETINQPPPEKPEE